MYENFHLLSQFVNSLKLFIFPGSGSPDIDPTEDHELDDWDDDRWERWRGSTVRERADGRRGNVRRHRLLPVRLPRAQRRCRQNASVYVFVEGTVLNLTRSQPDEIFAWLLGKHPG